MSNAQSLARTNNIAHALGLTITLAQPGSTYSTHILAMDLLAIKARYHAPFKVKSTEILEAYLDAVASAFGSLAAGSLEAQVMESHSEFHALYVHHLECKARYHGFWYQDADDAATRDDEEEMYEDGYGGGWVPAGTTLEDVWAASYEYDPDAEEKLVAVTINGENN